MSQKERVSVVYDITRKAVGVDAEVIRKVEAIVYIMADKFLEANEMKQLKEEIKMTRLGKMLYDDGKVEGDKARLVSTITKKLQKGKTLEETADAVEESVDTVKQLIQEMEVKA